MFFVYILFCLLGFLNEMCHLIVDFQDRKLKMFKGEYGNVLQEFVDKYPDKKSYFEVTFFTQSKKYANSQNVLFVHDICDVL